MLSSDCRAMSGMMLTTARRLEAMTVRGIARPRPITKAPEIQASTMSASCMASTGSTMTRVLARTTDTGECGEVRMAFQLVPRCSIRHAAEASRATPNEQKNIE